MVGAPVSVVIYLVMMTQLVPEALSHGRCVVRPGL